MNRFEKLKQEKSYTNEERQVIVPSLVLGFLISMFGYLYFSTIDAVEGWFMSNEYMDQSIGLILSIVGMVVFLLWFVIGTIILRRETILPIRKYSSSQRRSVTPPILLGLFISIIVFLIIPASIENWMYFEWFLQDDYIRESYLFILSIVGIICYTIWLILLNTKVLLIED